MKRYTLILFFIFLFATNNAHAQFTFGVKGGLTYSSFGGDALQLKSRVGYQIGPTLDIALSDVFFIQTELNLKMLNFRTQSVDVPKPQIVTDTKTMYLQMPFHAAFYANLYGTTSIMFHGGPYVAYGVSGKTKDINGEVDFFGKNQYKPFDYGIGAGVLVDFGKSYIDLGYDKGMHNLHRYKLNLHTQNTYLTYGYLF